MKNPRFRTTGISSGECNLLNLEEVMALSRQWNPQATLIICAAIGRARQDDPSSFLQNITIAAHLAEALKKRRLEHCLFLSSIDVYGASPADQILNEKTLPAPNGYYGWSKFAGEFLLRKALEDHQTVLTILRLSGVYGPEEDAHSPVNIWMRQALHEGRISLFGDGSERRDYVWREDLYPLICRLIEKRIEGTFNVAAGQSYSLVEVIEEIKKNLQKPVEVVRLGRQRTRIDYRFDTSALQKAIGPFSWTPLSEGLKSLYACSH